MQTDAFQLNAFQQDGGASTLFTLTATAALALSGTVSLAGDVELAIEATATNTLALSGTVALTGDVVTSDTPVVSTSINAHGRKKQYIVKGKRYYLTNEELAWMLARDLIDATREDVKVVYKNKKPHKVSQNAWTELQNTLKLFDKFDPVPWDDDEEAAMLLL